jgi:hypothetical protein
MDESNLGNLDKAANDMAAWLLEDIEDLGVHQYLCEFHSDYWKSAAEVAIRSARGEVDLRPFTTFPNLPR